MSERVIPVKKTTSPPSKSTREGLFSQAQLIIDPGKLAVRRRFLKARAKSKIDKGSKIHVHSMMSSRTEVRAEAELKVIEELLEQVFASVKEAKSREPAITGQALIREVSSDLAAKALEHAPPQSAAEGWEGLLLKGLRYKASLLQTAQFKSTTEAAETLGVGDPAIRRRIRENKLLALKSPSQEDYRIPIWALGLPADDTRALMAASNNDSWALYHFLATANGALNAMRPFELLLPTESLTFAQRGQREELLGHLGLDGQGPLFATVLDLLKAEAVPENQAA